MKQTLMVGKVAAFESSQKMTKFAAVLLRAQVWEVAELPRCESQLGQTSAYSRLFNLPKPQFLICKHGLTVTPFSEMHYEDERK